MFGFWNLVFHWYLVLGTWNLEVAFWSLLEIQNPGFYLGRLGEKIAADYLQKMGYKIIERNWKPQKWGEIDLIAIDDDTLVFVEVKARSVDPQLKPYEAVTEHKIQTLKRAGFIYSQEHPKLPKALRIDVVSVEFDQKQKPRIEYFKDVREGINS